MTTNPTDTQIATAALQAMYEAWEADGGPSPSTNDEAIVVAEALGVDPISDQSVIDEIWEQANQDSLELDRVAHLHVMAIAANTPATDAEFKGL